MHRKDRQGSNRPPHRAGDRISIRLLGGFDVRVNGRTVSERGWTRRSAASLVKILALAPGNRLHREQVIDMLWPDESPADAAPKLHKAAHYARTIAGSDAVVLRNDLVLLFPSGELAVDVAIFDELSRVAIADNDPNAARAAIARYSGELLPDDRYAEWAAERRELLRLRHLNLLRLAGQWMQVSELDPVDEHAHLELMRRNVANGDCDAALLQYERAERILDRELGIAPGPAMRQFRNHIESMIATTAGRKPEPRAFAALVAELSELTQRQVMLLETLTSSFITNAPSGPTAQHVADLPTEHLRH